jgi:uncharacterized lipoprotein YddW (UPF0748 family)
VSPSRPPALIREFRGVWVATLNNIDWPSRPNLPVDQQKAEFLAILDRAVQLNLNAVVLQVRPMCDALYPSKMEPWSEFLTGAMGRAPDPIYDPLEFAIHEAHRRGLELHAWFNPYRARHSASKNAPSTGHITRTRPELVIKYGPYRWLDPGEPAVEDYSRSVILDVVRRYDIDGVHIDDYFYPYPMKAAAGGVVDFPDDTTWKRYARGGGTLSRGDWRRANVDRFVQKLYLGIKKEKNWVKFGVSPFGIWRTGQPASVKGLSARDELFADSRKWLAAGWLDYLTPQLYWSIGSPQQRFPVLLQWWSDQNASRRHLWPGISLSETGSAKPRSGEEILGQVQLIRSQSGSDGMCFWSANVLVKNSGGLALALARSALQQPALVPASPWLDALPPPAPALAWQAPVVGGVQFQWSPGDKEPVRRWVLQYRTGGQWRTKVLPASSLSWHAESRQLPDRVAVMAVDLAGNTSAAAVAQRK